MTREIARQHRRDLASWQRAAVGLLALSTAINVVQYIAILSRDEAIEDLETRYRAARAIE